MYTSHALCLHTRWLFTPNLPPNKYLAAVSHNPNTLVVTLLLFKAPAMFGLAPEGVSNGSVEAGKTQIVGPGKPKY